MKALHTAVQQQQFDPAYLLYGDEEFRKEEALRYFIDHTVDAATRDFNLDVRKGGELSGESLASLLAMPPMMADRRVVVIRDVASLKKDARTALSAYLQAPAPDTLVVLVAAGESKPDKSVLGLATPVEFEPMTGARIPKWITDRAEKLGVTIADGAVTLLQNAVGADLSQLATELDKLVAYSGGGAITEDAVTAVVGVRREETLSELLDAVAMRDVSRALPLVAGVLQQPKVTGVFIVMTLTTQTLALAIGKTRNARRPFDYIQILKSGSSNVAGRAWGEAADSWARATPKWTLPELDHALDVLLHTDLALKSSRVSSEEQVVATAILAMCSGLAQRNAA